MENEHFKVRDFQGERILATIALIEEKIKNLKESDSKNLKNYAISSDPDDRQHFANLSVEYSLRIEELEEILQSLKKEKV